MADWEIIEETVITGSTTHDISFTSIPSTYQHLELTASVQINSTQTTFGGNMMYMYWNGENTGNHLGYIGWTRSHYYDSLPAINFGYSSTTNYAEAALCNTTACSATTWTSVWILIPNYTNTSTLKSAICRSGNGPATGGTNAHTGIVSPRIVSGDQTSAISQINLMTDGASRPFAVNTTFMLAGFKG